VIFTFEFCSTKALITGTVIATSPMADNRITAICWIGFDKEVNLTCHFDEGEITY
jgi:hypothetical protein